MKRVGPQIPEDKNTPRRGYQAPEIEVITFNERQRRRAVALRRVLGRLPRMVWASPFSDRLKAQVVAVGAFACVAVPVANYVYFNDVLDNLNARKAYAQTTADSSATRKEAFAREYMGQFAKDHRDSDIEGVGLFSSEVQLNAPATAWYAAEKSFDFGEAYREELMVGGKRVRVRIAEHDEIKTAVMASAEKAGTIPAVGNFRTNKAWVPFEDGSVAGHLGNLGVNWIFGAFVGGYLRRWGRRLLGCQRKAWMEFDGVRAHFYKDNSRGRTDWTFNQGD